MDRDEILEKCKLLVTSIKKALKRDRVKLKKQSEELNEASQWERLSHFGDTLMANRDAVKKGMKSISLPDVHSGEVVEIPLNPKCSVDKSAELLYKKARRGKRGYDTCLEKVSETEAHIEQLQGYLDEVREYLEESIVGREESVNSRVEELDKVFDKPTSGGSKGKKEVKLPFRHYEIDGYHIYAGKTSRDNDELSTRFAKPSDVWFHAVGYAGSHVIIRRGRGEPMPPTKIIEIAGGISIFFSKAKNTSYAEVHMTEARFVRKPRKSPPGLVTAERCKTLRMSPLDPQKLFK